jgi:pimeloyl-ACP methyl ester carboxylesterase
MTNETIAGEAVEVDGLRVFVRDRGAGTPLLLIHGAGPCTDGEAAWDPIVPALSASFRTLAIDVPGYGRSDALRVADTPANVAQHLVRLLDQLEIPQAVIVGHSRGGRISGELAAAAPERVLRLIVIGSGSFAPGGHIADDGKYTSSALSIVKFGADGDTSFEAYKATRRTVVYNPGSYPDDVLEAAYARASANGRMAEYVRRMAAFDPLAFYNSGDAEEFNAKVRGLRMPVSVIWGREDMTSSVKKSVPLIDMIENIEYHCLSHCGHSVVREYPEIVVALMTDFVRRGEVS